MSEFSLGLDFGTSTTLVALPGLEPLIFPIGKDGGNSWLPSVLSTTDGQSWLVGEDADKGAIVNQFRSPKSAITMNENELKNANGFSIDADSAIRRIIEEVVLRCKEKGLNNFAEVRLSCPAMWTGEQRKRLVRLVNEAGLVSDIDQVIDEPISASISWWWSRFSQGLKISEKKRAVIFDLGGGTLDVAVVDIYPKPGMPEMTILSARGIAIAGDTLDKELAEYITQRLIKEKSFDVSAQEEKDVVAVAIRLAAREVKEILSSVDETTFEVDPRIARVPSIKISRFDLNNVFDQQMKLALNCVDAALREARMKAGDNSSGPDIAKISTSVLGSEIDFVVLAGGMSQIKKVEDDLQKLMPKATVEFATGNSSTSTQSIVLGTSNVNEFANLNIHRPNFNFVAVYRDRSGIEHREILYQAFTPLYSPDQVMRGDLLLGYFTDWKPRVEPISGKIVLALDTIGGRQVSLRITSKLNGIIDLPELHADTRHGITLKLLVNGRIQIRDRSGRVYSYRIREWPHIRWTSANDSEKMALKMEEEPIIVSETPHIDAWRYK